MNVHVLGNETRGSKMKVHFHRVATRSLKRRWFIGAVASQGEMSVHDQEVATRVQNATLYFASGSTQGYSNDV